jgi:hypothetical protein
MMRVAAHHHADAIHRQGHANARRAQVEPADRIGHEDGEDHEASHAEHELRDEDRPQQGMVKDERRAFPDLLQRMAATHRGAHRLDDPRQQPDRNHRQSRGKAEGRTGTDPADQQAAECRAAGKGDGTGQLDARVRGRQRSRRHKRGHQRRGGDAVDDGAAHCDEAQESQQRQGDPAEHDQAKRRQQRGRPQRLGARHQPSPRQAVGHQARRNGEQNERQGERGLQQAGLALARAEQQHGDDRRGGQRDLLRRLRREIGPSQAVEGRGQFLMFGHRGS